MAGHRLPVRALPRGWAARFFSPPCSGWLGGTLSPVPGCSGALGVVRRFGAARLVRTKSRAEAEARWWWRWLAHGTERALVLESFGATGVVAVRGLATGGAGRAVAYCRKRRCERFFHASTKFYAPQRRRIDPRKKNIMLAA